MTKHSEEEIVSFMNKLACSARSPESALRFAASLFSVEPCPKCDYIKEHCRCGSKKTERTEE